MSLTATLLAAAAAVGALLIAGVFFAFSNFVMKALDRVPPAAGIAAMQSINVMVLNPLFLGVFLGTGLVSLAAVVVHWQGAGRYAALAGAVLYVAGTVIVTVRCNVPRNEQLARLDAMDEQSVAAWRRYVAEWTFWNHVRTAAAVGAGACFVVCIMASG